MKHLITILMAVVCCGCSEIRPVNPGAKLLIYQGVPDGVFANLSRNHHVRGHFEPPVFGISRIYVKAPLGVGAYVLCHEYQHAVEAALEGDLGAQRKVRALYRSMMTPDWEYGYADLMDPIP